MWPSSKSVRTKTGDFPGGAVNEYQLPGQRGTCMAPKDRQRTNVCASSVGCGVSGGGSVDGV